MHGFSAACCTCRAADDVVGIAKLCAQLGVPHIINNAYGVQSAQLCAAITSALRKGRVDAIVQSTDKNFMVPVAGAVVAAPRSRPQLVQVGHGV
jgi:O-phospho-L-seryl-tRNASec:L-selenocysteinyl-tRNA synthase